MRSGRPPRGVRGPGRSGRATPKAGRATGRRRAPDAAAGRLGGAPGGRLDRFSRIQPVPRVRSSVILLFARGSVFSRRLLSNLLLRIGLCFKRLRRFIGFAGILGQRRFGGSTLGTPARIVQEYGASSLSRGATMTMGREAMFTMSMLGVTPLIQQKLVESSGWERNTALAAGSLSGALLAGVITHPMDTIKTCMQGDIEGVTYGSLTQTAKTVYSESGVAGFYRGVQWRTSRLICLVGIINLIKEPVAKVMYPHHFK